VVDGGWIIDDQVFHEIMELSGVDEVYRIYRDYITNFQNQKISKKYNQVILK